MFVVSVRERGKEAHKFTFRKRQITVGRLRINDIILPKRNISKRHAKFEINPDNQIMVYDMGSTNGTFVNAVRATTGVLVGPNDKVFVGDYILQLQLVEDKSAIDLRDPLPGATGYSMPEDGDGDVKATIAGLDTRAIQEELRRLGYKSPMDEMGATSSIMIDPSVALAGPPPLSDLDEEAPPSVGADGNLLAVEVDSEESIEAEMPPDDFGSAPELPPDLGSEMVEDSVEMEEVLDIPLEEEEEPAPLPAPKPVSPPMAHMPPPRAAYTQAASFTERPTITAIPSPVPAAPLPIMRAERPLSAPAPIEAVVVPKRETPAAPLSNFAAVWDVLDNDLVAEVFVGSQGAVKAYGKNGDALNLGGPLQSAAAVRALADFLLPGDDVAGTVTMAMGMAYVLRPATGSCSVRLVKTPGLPSLSGLQERRLMSMAQGALMRRLVDEGNSIIILGGGAMGDSVVQALSGLYTSARKVMMVGPGWSIANSEARAVADYSLVGTAAFPLAVAGLHVDAVLGQHLPGQALPRLLAMSAGTGVPFVVSLAVPAGAPQAIIEALLKLDGDFRPTMLHAALALCNVTVFTTTKMDGRLCLEAAMRLVVDSETDRPMLVPFE